MSEEIKKPEEETKPTEKEPVTYTLELGGNKYIFQFKNGLNYGEIKFALSAIRDHFAFSEGLALQQDKMKAEVESDAKEA